MTTPIWAILICTMPNRAQFFAELMAVLKPQVEATGGLVTIITDDDTTVTIGTKRNRLVNQCTARYSSFIDDDDMVAEDYVAQHLRILQEFNGIDGIGFKGILTQDGRSPRQFIHSGQYKEWFERQTAAGTIYYRCLNHWNVIKNQFRIDHPFPEINHGEDHAQSIEMQQHDCIQTYLDITEKPMYYYRVRTGVSITTMKR